MEREKELVEVARVATKLAEKEAKEALTKLLRRKGKRKMYKTKGMTHAPWM
jgi:hypothetical protein